MYLLVSNQNDPLCSVLGVSKVMYKTPCGSMIHIANVAFGNDIDTTMISFAEPIITLKQLFEVQRLVFAEFYSPNDN